MSKIDCGESSTSSSDCTTINNSVGKKRERLLNTTVDTHIREISNLFVHAETLSCARDGKCIPCLYKIFPFGHGDLPPNQRPELCPRSKILSKEGDSIGLYRRGDKCLTIGDGDFSFSAALSSHLSGLVASSYESEHVLRSIYPNFEKNLKKLQKSAANILYQVDGTDLTHCTTLDNYEAYFDVVIWNFPCVAVQHGQDGQLNEINENIKLIQSFFKCVKGFLNTDGEVHLTHKICEPFSWWKIKDIAASEGWFYQGSVVFDKYMYPSYTNRKALDKKSFPIHDAEVIETSYFIIRKYVYPPNNVEYRRTYLHWKNVEAGDYC